MPTVTIRLSDSALAALAALAEARGSTITREATLALELALAAGAGAQLAAAVDVLNAALDTLTTTTPTHQE